MPDYGAVPEYGAVPDYSAAVFGAQLASAVRYAQLLRGPGIERGLLGPREADRIWDRHLVNCAVVADLVPRGERVVDVGSGAGLPGLVLAVRRPDLRVDLIESLSRRVDFLTEVVSTLDLGDRVRVVHGRAEDAAVRSSTGGAGWVTARALAPLDRLVRWCLPLLRPGGQLLAMKGARAAGEVAEHGASIGRAGGSTPRVVRLEAPAAARAAGLADDVAATVVVIERTERAIRNRRGRV